MKRLSYPTASLILIGLFATASITYVLGRLYLDPVLPGDPGLPPLSKLEVPTQTQNGYTATVEYYYADAMRLVFQVKVTGGKGNLSVERFSLKDESGEEINAGVGSYSRGTSPFYVTLDFNPVVPLKMQRFNGQLAFAVVTSPGDDEVLAPFSFDLSLPIHPAMSFNPKQTVSANGMEILLDRLVVTPAYTYAYLCYLKPTEADWMINYESNVQIGSQKATVGTYGLLFDSTYADGSKGGEPGWTPPVQMGRCVKAGFPIGDANPSSMTLTIAALEQSMPEVIPAEEATAAQERLKEQGIDMEWHIVDHGAYPEYEKLPAGMSQQAAFRKFIEALGYVYKGPWVFKVQIASSENSQPAFSTSEYGAATPIPLPTSEPHVAATLPGRIRAFDISPDLKTIAFATSQGVVLYDLETYIHLRTLNDSENFFSVAWSPDGTKLATGSIVMYAEESGTPHLIVWDADTWNTVFVRESTEEVSIPFGAIAWSPDGKLLAASLPERGLVALDIESGKIVAQQKDFLVPPYDISWSPDGARLIATGDLGFGFRRWRPDTGEAVRLYDSRAGAAALQLDWSPDGKRIASGHGYGTVCFWTVATNKCDGLIHAHQNAVYSLAWSPDGSQLATGGGVIRIWDSQTGKLLTAFGLNDGSIYTQLLWPASDQPLVSLEAGYASEGLTIVRFWDVDKGKVLFEFHGASGFFGD